MVPKLKRATLFLTIAISIFGFYRSNANATIYYVATAGSASNTGLSWSSPKPDIQAAISSAHSGDQVWVAKGTYTGQFTGQAGIALYGGFAGIESSITQRNISANATILDAAGIGHAYSITSSTASDSVLDGFTLEHGNTLPACYVAGNGNMTISNCTITNSTSLGVHSNSSGNLSLDKCTFSNDAGAVTVNAGNLSVTNCDFEANYGGGIDSYVQSVTVQNSEFIGNNSGIDAVNVGTLEIDGCTFEVNDIGVRFISDSGTSKSSIAQCTFTANKQAITVDNIGNPAHPAIFKDNLIEGPGDGIVLTLPYGYDWANIYASIRNNTITDCSNGIQFDPDFPDTTPYVVVDIANNVVYNNQTGIDTFPGSQVNSNTIITLSHNDLFENTLNNYRGITPGITDVSVDPHFLSVLGDDYELKKGSPLIDSGDNNYVSPLDTDLIDSPRIIDSIVDLGCYEYKPATSNTRFDFNNDGQSDLLWEDSLSGNLLLWTMNDEQPLAYGSPFAEVSDLNWKVVATPDVNSDGHPGLLWWNSKTGSVLVWTMNGTKVLNYGQPFAQVKDTSWIPVATGDFDGAANWSLIWQNSTTGNLLRWRLHGTTVTKYGSTFAQVPPTTHVVGFTDFDGDGHSDLLFWDSQTGIVSLWLMNDTTLLTNEGLIKQILDTTWHVVGAPDMNSDGHPDILWQNSKSGQVLRWLMKNITVVDSGFVVSSGVSTNWQIAGLK